MLFNAVCSVKSDMNLYMEIASATVIIFFCNQNSMLSTNGKIGLLNIFQQCLAELSGIRKG